MVEWVTPFRHTPQEPTAGTPPKVGCRPTCRSLLSYHPTLCRPSLIDQMADRSYDARDDRWCQATHGH